MVFRKVADPSTRTRFLFATATGTGPGLASSLAVVTALFQRFCEAPQVVVPPAPGPAGPANHVYVILQSADQAAAAIAALHDRPLAGMGEGRTLRLHFSNMTVQFLPGFVDEAEEAALLAAVQEAEAGWHTLAKRRVQHYGWAFDYAPLDQLTVNEYPPGVGLAPHIDTHEAFTGAIVSLSLGSGTVMELRRGVDHRPLLLPPRSLLVLAGESRYAWQHYIPCRKTDDLGQGRSQARGTRVSLTFRQIRGYACDCAWPEHCDSRQGGPLPTRLQQLAGQEAGAGTQRPAAPVPPDLPPQHGASSTLAGETAQALTAGPSQLPCRPTSPAPLPPLSYNADLKEDEEKEQEEQEQGVEEKEEEAAAALEATHVHAVYDAIASHFSATRFAVWPKVREFMAGLPPGALVADVGCGNGKYFGVRKDVAVLGSDRSIGLASVAARRLDRAPGLRADVVQADGLRLPYRAGCADAVLCIAVLHHVSSAARRRVMLQQLVRLLRPGGRALVTVWAMEQEEPQRTLHKWTRLATAAGPEAAPGPGNGPPLSSSATSTATDYMVPWNVPFHRPDAAAAVKHAQQPGPCSTTSDGAAAPLASVHATKGVVVFQRYYHLFPAGELEALVATVPGCRLLACELDKSNWCAVLERSDGDAAATGGGEATR